LDGGILRFLGGTSATNIALDVNRGITLTTASGSAFQVEGSNVTIPGLITGPGSLTKTGALTLTLNGANTYADTNVNAGTLVVSSPLATLGTGNVTITAGTLRISSDVTNAIADTAAVDIVGGKLNLELGINDLVASLMLGGLPQAGGTYGSTASAATFQNDVYFSGSGILTVPGPSLPGDFNNDGKVNAADYVLWRKDPGSFGGPGGYATWRANFGDPPGAGSGLEGGSVPEPASAVLVLLGIGAFVLRRRGQR
jgi:autotransporter-associated beta strand protein